MQFNLYDVLVFEDELGNIYQDCIRNIETGSIKQCVGYDLHIQCNIFYFFVDLKTDRFSIIYSSDYFLYNDRIHTFRLKEIWIKKKKIYKKTWEK